MADERNDIMLVGVSCNWSRYRGACSCLEAVQALEICHPKLVQAFAVRIRSVTYRETIVDLGQDGGIDGALEGKRRSWWLHRFCEGTKLCISDNVIASHTKPNAIFTAGFALVALDHSCQHCMLKRLPPFLLTFTRRSLQLRHPEVDLRYALFLLPVLGRFSIIVVTVIESQRYYWANSAEQM
jgi:hypothetical protein